MAKRAASAKIKRIENLETSIDEQIADIESSIQKAIEDKLSKCEAAKSQLVDMIKITADKYRTATGTAEALRVIRFVRGEDDNTIEDIRDANELAREMAEVCSDMHCLASDLDPSEMDNLCNGFYAVEFNADEYANKVDYALALEMLKIDLCRNVGGSAEDMVSFWNRANEEINAMQNKIDELKSSKESSQED